MLQIAENRGSWGRQTLRCLIAIASLVSVPSQPIFAQIIPDSTPSSQQSSIRQNQIVVNGLTADLIEDGARRGAALFHSFSEFNVGAGEGVYFANPAGIAAIFSRVTGSNPSEILGTLGVNGTASLIFLNPNGITFGPDAQLDIRGSFVASTANSVIFENGVEFSATHPESPPLLTINLTPGLQYGTQNSAAIQNAANLQVGEDLTLVGGSVVSLGTLTASTGKLTVAAFQGDVSLQDIRAQSAQVEAVGSITTQTITLTQPDPDSEIVNSPPALILQAGMDNLENLQTLINPTPSVDPTPPTQPQPPTSSSLVYENDFEGDVGSEWSNNSTDVTPAGNRIFLGQFGNETVSLTLSNLEPKTEGTVSFDLFIIGTWDGNQEFQFFLGVGVEVGPDIWELKADNSTLLLTTFSNQDSSVPFPKSQSYPNQPYPNSYNPSNPVQNPARTGADLNITLGYTYSYRTDSFMSVSKPADSVYHLSFPLTVSSNGSLQLEFSASGLEDIDNESWGLDNVNVSLSNVPSPSPPTLPPPNPSSLPIFPSLSEPSAGTITTGKLFTPGSPVILSAPRDINLTGSITSQGGDIRLNSGGTINSLNNTIDASHADSGNSGTIDWKAAGIILDNSQLTSTINTLGNGGDINLTAESVSLLNNSAVVTQGLGKGQAGNINVTASESVILSGASGLLSDNQGVQPTGNVTINTGQLVVQDGSIVSTFTNSENPNGRGGTITVNASDSVFLSGTDSNTSIPSSLISLTLGEGDAGDLMINTPQLTVQNGALVVASTTSSSTGQGGSITVNADLINLNGVSENQVIPSGLYVDTLGAGDAGQLRIESRKLLVQNGAIVSASSVGTGNGGDIIVNASESIELIKPASDVVINGGIYARSFDTGKAGNLTIETPLLTVRDGNVVSVSSQPQKEGANNLLDQINALFDALSQVNQTFPNPFFGIGSQRVTRGEGSGDAGDINITANRLVLDNQGQIIAQTTRSEGGNIALNVQDLLLLRRESRISTTAGTAQAGGNGGNITINTPNGFIVAVSPENSDITANAFEGNGGNITIATQEIFGLKFRPHLTEFSDITVTSILGVDGTFNLDTPEIDPNSGLVNLPAAPGVPQPLSICQSGAETGNFVNTGLGGFPINPDEPLGSNDILEDLRLPTQLGENTTASTVRSRPIVEAKGWIVNQQGQVVLVAEKPSVGSVYRCGDGQ